MMSIVPSRRADFPFFSDYGSDDFFDRSTLGFPRTASQLANIAGGSLAKALPRGANLRTEFRERDNDYVLNVDVPGLNKRDVKLCYDSDNNTLTVSAEHKDEEKGENERVHWSERSYGYCSRMLRLPEGVNGKNISASQNEGVLRICIPKSAAGAEKKKTIMIK